MIRRCNDEDFDGILPYVNWGAQAIYNIEERFLRTFGRTAQLQQVLGAAGAKIRC